MKAIEKRKIMQQKKVNKKKENINTNEDKKINRKNRELQERFEIHQGDFQSFDFSIMTR